MNGDALQLYQQILNHARSEARVQRVLLGLNWSCVQVAGSGICFSPLDVPRTLTWPGTLVGRSARELAAWLLSWHPAEACVGLATVNALLNHDSALLHESQWLQNRAPGHLRVFEHFRPMLAGKQVVVIGRYPGLEKLWPDVHFHCIERRAQAEDYPEMAAEWLLPQADWAFITASSIANKSVHRLLTLASGATVVLMGPSLPWLELWRDYGVDYLAGIHVRDEPALWQVAAEGGGTRLFADAVQYALVKIGA